MHDVFEFKHYREYLLSRLGKQGTRTGFRQKAAQAMGCHNTYLSQVLSGKIDLSLEYAEALNEFFNHSKSEAEFFILLVLSARAGSTKLQKRFEEQIKQQLSKRLVIKDRMGEIEQISDNDRERFYSHWIYGALHVLVSIAKFQTIESLSEALGLRESSIRAELDFLRRIGIIKFEKSKFRVGSKSIHVAADSPSITKHHLNWRYHTIENLFRSDADDLHFSSVVTLDADAVTEVRKVLLRALEKNRSVITAAKEEVAYVMNFDFYKLA